MLTQPASRMAVDVMFVVIKLALTNLKSKNHSTELLSAMLAMRFTTLWRLRYLDRIKIKNYLNIAHKAGYIIFSGDKLASYNKKMYLVLYDSNSAKTTLKLVEELKSKYTTLSVDNLGELVSIKTCKILGIKNKNLSDIIQNLIEN